MPNILLHQHHPTPINATLDGDNGVPINPLAPARMTVVDRAVATDRATLSVAMKSDDDDEEDVIALRFSFV